MIRNSQITFDKETAEKCKNDPREFAKYLIYNFKENIL